MATWPGHPPSQQKRPFMALGFVGGLRDDIYRHLARGICLMGCTKDWWQEEIDRLVEQWTLGEISRKDALRELHRKGLDLQEARDLLNEAIS